MKGGRPLEKILAAEPFAVPAELGPPRSGEVEPVPRKIASLRGSAEAYNLTDNQTAVVRMSSLAMKQVWDLGEKGAILGGLIGPKSARMLRYRDASGPGGTGPKALVQRLEQAGLLPRPVGQRGSIHA